MPDFTALGKLIVDVGILPAIIAGQGYLLYLALHEHREALGKLTGSIEGLTAAQTRLVEWVKGGAGRA